MSHPNSFPSQLSALPQLEDQVNFLPHSSLLHHHLTNFQANPPTVANPFANPSATSEAPPSYTAVDPVADDPLAFLSEFDTTFVIDDSGSMQISKPSNTPTRWAQVSRALADIAPICTKYDEDGVDIYFLNNPDKDRYKNIKRAKTVHEIFNQFEPAGKTPTGKKLKAILDPYLEKCKTAHARGSAWP